MLINNDCLLALDELEENSVDAIVTDPPYELNFMGKGWDNAGISFSKDTWAKCLRVLKPGGYMLAFGGTRTYHRIACAIEDAGFEIRDCIMWLYGSGFPKSMNIGLAIDKKKGIESEIVGHSTNKIHLENLGNAGYKEEFDIKKAQNEWAGWGTALKPSYEPIVVARKPLDGSCVANVMKWGVGGLNIDECRIETTDKIMTHSKTSVAAKSKGVYGDYGAVTTHQTESQKLGRFPANTILGNQDGEEWRRYFYCAKASKKDRNEGLEEFEEDTTDDGRKKPIDNPYLKGGTMRHNTHPTVKPTTLMQYLIRLVTPRGGTVLDPFMGSGSTGKAVACENNERNAEYKFIGIEKETEYCKIAEARIKYVEQSERQQKLI